MTQEEDTLALAVVRQGLRRWSSDDLAAGLERFRQRREADQRVAGAAAAAQTGLRRWGPSQLAAGLQEFRFRRAEPRRRALPFVLAAALLLLGVGLWRARAITPFGVEPKAVALSSASPIASTASLGGSHLLLDDGSEVRLADPQSRARVTESSPRQVVVALETGEATFHVPHRPERLFLVQVGDVLIEDIGTVFRVSRSENEVSVHVLEGKVRVRAGDALEELTGGGQGSYSLRRLIAAVPSATVAPSAHAPPVVTPREVTWQSLAQQTKYAGAFELLEREGFDSIGDAPQDLLLAADVARLSGHPAQAVAPLRRLSERHAGDPRAPAAAFTLGSLLLRDLKNPAAAARAFARAEQLAPGGNLAEDALARSAEAWQRAGDVARAEGAVTRYRARYPRGRHLAFLERLLQTSP